MNTETTTGKTAEQGSGKLSDAVVSGQETEAESFPDNPTTPIRYTGEYGREKKTDNQNTEAGGGQRSASVAERWSACFISNYYPRCTKYPRCI